MSVLILYMHRSILCTYLYLDCGCSFPNACMVWEGLKVAWMAGPRQRTNNEHLLAVFHMCKDKALGSLLSVASLYRPIIPHLCMSQVHGYVCHHVCCTSLVHRLYPRTQTSFYVAIGLSTRVKPGNEAMLYYSVYRMEFTGLCWACIPMRLNYGFVYDNFQFDG